MAAPIASEPTSPMNTCAGAAFHHRKPRQAPSIAAATMARSSEPAGSTWYPPGGGGEGAGRRHVVHAGVTKLPEGDDHDRREHHGRRSGGQAVEPVGDV